MSLSEDNQSDVIEAFNSTSRYLDDLLNIDNNFFDSMVNRIYPSELQLNKADVSDTETSFLDLHLSISDGFVQTKIYDKRDDFDFGVVNFPFLDGDVLDGGFLVHKDVVGAVLGCQPVSSRLISIRLRAAPFNITIIQVYAPTSGHDDSEVDHFYQQLQETIDKTPKKDILVVQGDWNPKVGKDAQADWGEVCGPYCNVETNERGLRLLEFATFNNLVLTNTLGPHKPSRRWTWHSPDGKHHNQIDYILVKKRFRSGVNIHRTRSFPGADIGSDHDLVMMTFQVRLKKTRKPNQPRLRFDLEKLRDPDVACTFQATIGGKFAPLIGLSDEDMDMDTMITTYNTAVTDAASEILGKERRRKKPWVTKDSTSVMKGEI